MNLSFIVPVYATDLVLVSELLKSLIDQNTTYTYEVIVVDDGNANDYADDLAKVCGGFRSVTLLRKDNGGVSAARNFGAAHSRGEYVSFVDSDDLVSPFLVQDFLDAAYRYDADYVVGRLCDVPTDRVATRADLFSPANDATASSVTSSSLFGKFLLEGLNDNGDSRYRSVPTCRIVKSGLNASHPFDPRFRLGEDTLWNADVLAASDTVVELDNCYYIYRFNEDSSSKRFDSRRLDDSRRFLEALKPRLSLIDGSLENLFGVLTILWLVSLCKNYFFHPKAPFDGVSELRETVKSPFWASAVHLRNGRFLPLRYRAFLFLLVCRQYRLVSLLCRR